MQPNPTSGNRQISSSIVTALRSLSVEELDRNKLLSFAVSRGAIANEEGRVRLLANLRRESLMQAVLAELADHSTGLDIRVLKGAALWDDLYRPGEREASDLDLHIDQEANTELLARLAKMGFDRQFNDGSRISGFKTVCLGDRFGDLSIEVHTRLWWREPDGFAWHWRPGVRPPFRRLTLEDQLIHLCGHWVAQHTMISLHWLLDIVLLLEREAQTLDWPLVESRASELGLSRAIRVARERAQSVINNGHLPKRLTGVRYLLQKHRVQENWRVALAYDWNWLRRAFSDWPG